MGQVVMKTLEVVKHNLMAKRTISKSCYSFVREILMKSLLNFNKLFRMKWQKTN